MFRKILVPTDGSALSEKAAAAAIGFARTCGAKIVGMTVAQPYLSFPLELTSSERGSSDFNKKALSEARLHVKSIREAAEKDGVECETLIAEALKPSDEIVATAKRHGCDAIFMGSHWRTGLSRLLLGGETEQVLVHSDVPVMVFR